MTTGRIDRIPLERQHSLSTVYHYPRARTRAGTLRGQPLEGSKAVRHAPQEEQPALPLTLSSGQTALNARFDDHLGSSFAKELYQYPHTLRYTQRVTAQLPSPKTSQSGDSVVLRAHRRGESTSTRAFAVQSPEGY